LISFNVNNLPITKKGQQCEKLPLGCEIASSSRSLSVTMSFKDIYFQVGVKNNEKTQND